MKKIQITDLSMDELKKILSEVMNECMNTNGSSDSDIIGIDEVCKMTGMSKYTVYKKTSNRSEEHTSELQSLRHLVCRLLLEKMLSVMVSDDTR